MLMNQSPKTKKLGAIHAQLRQEILSGVWEIGGKLPNEIEIAQRFECSPGTISKALALLVHEGLVERKARAGTHVLRNTIEERPPQTANKLDSFAFIYPSEQHEGIWRTVKGFQAAARDADRRIVMLSTGTDYRKEAEYIGRLSEFDVRGAVIYPVISNPQELVQLSQMLVSSKFPVVLAEVHLPGLGCPSVIIDGFHAGHTMANHMIQRGAQRIGYFSNYAWAPFMRDRYNGYRWALREAGIEEPADGVFLESSMNPNFSDPLAEPTQMAEIFLRGASKLEAVVCADDYLAMGCVLAAEKLGIRIPDDMLVSGIDDYASFTTPSGLGLTSYQIPFEEMGSKTFEVLEARVDAGTNRYNEIQLRGSIVIRGTA